MSRPTAQSLRIAQGVADAIRGHAAEFPDWWWKLPETVARGLRLSYGTARRPVVCVAVDGGEVDDQGMSDDGIEEIETLNLVVYGLVEDEADPEAAALELLSDVRRALALNRQLIPPGGETPMLTNGFIHDNGFEITPQPPDAGPLAEFELRLTAKYHWSASTV